MSILRVNEFRMKVNNLPSNHRLYVNVISATPAVFNELRKLISTGVVKPDIEEVKKVYKDIDAVMEGRTILPQMYYIKL